MLVPSMTRIWRRSGLMAIQAALNCTKMSIRYRNVTTSSVIVVLIEIGTADNGERMVWVATVQMSISSLMFDKCVNS